MYSLWLRVIIKIILKIVTMSVCQKTKENEEPLLANQIIDFRNGRYQGSADLFTRRPCGKGMFLDQNYLFVLSSWLDGLPNGKTFAVFPDQHLFYGCIADNRTSKLCAYKQPGKYTVYLKNCFNQNNVAIIDDYLSQSLLVLYVNCRDWQRMASKEDELEERKLMEVVAHRAYLSEEEKWRVIEEYVKERVEGEHRHYSSFIASAFSAGNSSLSSYENSSEYELSYEGSSIVCKISKHPSLEEDYSVKLIGIYDEDQEVFEAFKRAKGDRAEEFVKGCAPVTYAVRPKECLKNMREFYKKSTIFCNSFVRTHSLQHIKSLFMAISHHVDHFLTHKYAETFIFNLAPSNQPHDSKNEQSPLGNICKELSQAVRNKKARERNSIEVQDPTFREYLMMPEQKQARRVNDENEGTVAAAKRRKELRPLNESFLEANASPQSQDLKQLAQDVFSIQRQIRRTAQTPLKHSNHSTAKPSPSPKAHNSKRSERSNVADCEASSISASPWRARKLSKLSWR